MRSGSRQPLEVFGPTCEQQSAVIWVEAPRKLHYFVIRGRRLCFVILHWVLKHFRYVDHFRELHRYRDPFSTEDTVSLPL